MKTINLILGLPLWLKLTISVLLVLLILVAAFLFNVDKFEQLSRRSLVHIDDAYSESIQLTKTAASDSLSKAQINVLLSKTSIIERNKSHHLYNIKTLSKNKYALYTMFPFLSAITAIFIFLIIQKGWHSTNTYVKAYFVFFTTLTSLVGIYPDVYQATEGIAEHTQSYLDYDNLQKKVFAYSLTAPMIEGDTIQFNQFIDRVNTQERSLSTLRFDIEKKSLDKEIFNSVDMGE